MTAPVALIARRGNLACPRCGTKRTHLTDVRAGYSCALVVRHGCPHGVPCGEGDPETRGMSEWCERCERGLRKAWQANARSYFTDSPVRWIATAWARSAGQARGLWRATDFGATFWDVTLLRASSSLLERVYRAPAFDAPLDRGVPAPQLRVHLDVASRSDLARWESEAPEVAAREECRRRVLAEAGVSSEKGLAF